MLLGAGALYTRAPVSVRSHRKCSVLSCPSHTPSLAWFNPKSIVTETYCLSEPLF